MFITFLTERHSSRTNIAYFFSVITKMDFFFLWRCDPRRARASSFRRFLDHTQRRTTVGRTPLDEWSARRRGLYLTPHNIHNRQITMPPKGFEPKISAGERPQTYALDRAATGMGNKKQILVIYVWFVSATLSIILLIFSRYNVTLSSSRLAYSALTISCGVHTAHGWCNIWRTVGCSYIATGSFWPKHKE